MTDLQTRKPRSDGRRNREKLLAAAVQAFSTSAADVPLDAIAKAAGVGIGTLYRHFPTRNALVAAAYRHEVERLCAAAVELDRLPADVGLRKWMEGFIEYVATKRGMGAALAPVAAADSTLFPEAWVQIRAAMMSFIERGAAAGLLRDDVDPGHIYQAMRGAWMVADEQQSSENAGRLLDLLLDGLRYRAAPPHP